MMMFLIERSECDDDDVIDRKFRVWWWWWCWLKVRSMMMMLLIERPKYDDDDVADRKVKVLMMMLLIERCYCWSKGQSVVAAEDWRWRLYVKDDEKLPMSYECITLMMLMMPSLSPTDVVVVVVEYPSR